MSQASKYKGAQNPFLTKGKLAEDGKGVVYFRTATCTKCGADGEWRDTSPSGAHVQAVTTGYRKMGWEMSERGKGTCPECLAKKRKKVGLSDLDKALGMNISPLGVVYRKRPEPADQSNPPRQATPKDYLTGPSPSQLEMSHIPTEQPMQVQEETPFKNPKKYNHLTFKEMLSLRKELSKVLTKRGNGLVEYAEGFNDTKVAELMAEKLGKRVTYDNVGGMRRSEFGQLNVTTKIRDARAEVEPKTITVTIDPNPELLATLAVVKNELDDIKSALLSLSGMAMDLADRCERLVKEGK